MCYGEPEGQREVNAMLQDLPPVLCDAALWDAVLCDAILCDAILWNIRAVDTARSRTSVAQPGKDRQARR